MSERRFATWPRVAGLTASACAVAAGGVMVDDLRWPAAAAVALWAAAGWQRFGLTGFLAASLPGLALCGGGFPSLIAWTAAGVAGGLAGRAAGQRESVWRARDTVRDLERERRELSKHNQHYPQLLEACLAFSNARDLQQLALILVKHTQVLVDDLDCVRVFFGPPNKPICLASATSTSVECPAVAGPDELYVAKESRQLLRRDGNIMHALLPLRGDRRRGEPNHDAPRGILSVRFRVDDLGDRLVLELIGALSRLAGIGLATVDLLAQAQSLALRDSLTGLYGRHECMRRLQEHTAAARRARSSLGVIMCDLDHLKLYNDQFGHPAGDAALRAVAKALHKGLPKEAIISRIGGEEFTVLLAGPTRASIAEASEAIRLAIAACIPDSTHPDRHLTASIGWALLAPDEDGAACLARADQAVYRAKANGRNRVEVAI